MLAKHDTHSCVVKLLISVDNILDLFAEHAISGAVGLLTNRFFGDLSVVALDGVSQFDGGWVDQNLYEVHLIASFFLTSAFEETTLLS